MLAPLNSNQSPNGAGGDPLLENSLNSSSTVRRSDAPLIRDFNASKQAELFATLKQLKFNGQLVLTDVRGRDWSFYLHRGFIVYVTGGEHPVRRWIRNSVLHMPQLPTDISALQYELVNPAAEKYGSCWQYQLLGLWVEQQKIATEHAARVIWSTIIEVLFDITQARQVTCELRPNSTLPKPLVLIEAEQAIVEADRLWQSWRAAHATDCSPNRVPMIRENIEVKHRISTSVYKMLNELLERQLTLREMAIEMEQEALTVLRSLLPYIQSRLVELRAVADLPAPAFSAPSTEAQEPLIACVDDNPWVCREMEKILTASSYRFIGLNDPLRAIGVLVSLKPDMIFLDLMMPNTNGYEICGRLRKISCFRYTPIVILTGNDGVIDRVRAKMVGSTDFLSKVTVDAQQVLGAINKHLKQGINLT